MAGGSATDEEGTKSTIKIMANIFISFIGAGVLGLPYAFKEAGVLEGVLVLIIVAVVSVKAMLLVIDCKYALTEKRLTVVSKSRKKPVGNLEEMEDLIDGLASADCEEIIPKAVPGTDLSYGDVGFHAFGSFGKLLVECAIILSQIGFCCAYLLFIMTNLEGYFPNINKNYWLIGLLPAEYFLCLFRNLKKLAFTSLFAQISNLMAFGVVFWFDFDEFHKISPNIHPKTFSLQGLPFFLCVAIYCYEGAGMILSLEASLHKDIRYKFRRYFLSVITLVTILYATFGACGYASFGPETADIITLNLPKPAAGGLDFATIVTSCLCLSLFFTYPIMMFPVMSILDKKMGVTSESPQAIKSNIVRLLLVGITGSIVLIIPDFGNLMAFIGATCCIWLAFILPAVFHMRICSRTLTPLQRWMDYLIIVMGVVGTIVGMIDAIKRMNGDIETTTKEVTMAPPACAGESTCTTQLETLTSTIKMLTEGITEVVQNLTSETVDMAEPVPT